jgi:beta-1,4-mannosyltransferase
VPPIGSSRFRNYLKEHPAMEERARSTAKVISLFPLEEVANAFPGMFARALRDQRYIIRAFQWGSLGLRRSDCLIVHWPEHLFSSRKSLGRVRAWARIGIVLVSKRLWGTKVVWVAHNAVAHDSDKPASDLLRRFFALLDGVIYLSVASRDLIQKLYPEAAGCRTLITVHGHYRGEAATPPTPAAKPGQEIKLASIGLIRPYKNIDVLVDVVSSIPSGFRLHVAGYVTDLTLRGQIEANARRSPHIRLEFRDTLIGSEEMERMIDAADAVVLPYKNILNSGSALLALSRNRPVLVPNLGSLRELRDRVGAEWVYLYDGDLNQQVLNEFRSWMLTTDRAGTAPLDAYEWGPIGDKLGQFIESLEG